MPLVVDRAVFYARTVEQGSTVEAWFSIWDRPHPWSRVYQLIGSHHTPRGKSVNVPYSDDRALLGWFCISEETYSLWEDADVPDSV